MTVVGRIESLWRYPVKSMRGERLEAAFAGFPGVYGDRVYAFRSSISPKGFPYFTARDQGQMLRYRAAFRHGDRMTMPPNLAEAEALPPGVTPLYADLTARSRCFRFRPRVNWVRNSASIWARVDSVPTRTSIWRQEPGSAKTSGWVGGCGSATRRRSR